jgi:hypothetical protein
MMAMDWNAALNGLIIFVGGAFFGCWVLPRWFGPYRRQHGYPARPVKPPLNPPRGGPSDRPKPLRIKDDRP